MAQAVVICSCGSPGIAKAENLTECLNILEERGWLLTTVEIVCPRCIEVKIQAIETCLMHQDAMLN